MADCEVIIRKADMRDIRNVFELSNDPTVRANSIHEEPILWENHEKWYSSAIDAHNTKFYVAETPDGAFVGQVRFCYDGSLWVVSISISAEFRGCGLANKILNKAMELSGARCFEAKIKTHNMASEKLFIASGYHRCGGETIGAEKFNVFRYTRGVFVIAEMSANHCGDFDLAKKIMVAAKESGADAVKIQTYTADTITIDCKNDEFLIKGEGNLWKDRYLYELYQKASTPWEWQPRLKEFADTIGIPFFSTPFDYTAVDFLEKMNVPMYKIASFEAMDYPLIKYAAKFGKPMIISTGVSSLEEMQGAIDACKEVGNNDITLLKCTSAYPARLEDMNLMTLRDMAERFGPQGVKVGLSDHSMSIEPVVTAVALGAKVIEKHFTLDRSLGGEDSGFSLNKDEFAAMVKAVRNAEAVLGSVDYSVNQGNRKFARSLYAVKDIKAGELFTNDNVRSIRPSLGLHPKFLPEILGKSASCDIAFGTPLSKGVLSDNI